jgi:FMN-dependent NADH-azoreductase
MAHVQSRSIAMSTKTLLQINTSLSGELGASTQLGDALVQRWLRQNPGGRVIRRDLAAQPLPHLDGARFGAFSTPAAERSPQQQAVVDESDALIAEVQAADVVVLAAPMYNFGMPSQLKAWFDHIARAGVTFRYSASGPVGLIGDRKVYVVTTRGGRHKGTPADTLSGHVTLLLNLIGIRDIEFVYAEGLNLGADVKASALALATAAIEQRLAA